jgi:23S rRNA-/tRNA-specific pseudouridylate synthase
MNLSKSLADLICAQVVFETGNFALLSKNHSVHSVSNYLDQPSLASALTSLVPALSECSPKPLDGGLVQRLDFETSGCILLAKSLESWHSLKAALSSNSSQKTYLVALDGKLSEPAVVEGWIGSPYRRAKKMQLNRCKNAPSRFLWSESKLEPLATSKELNLTIARVSVKAARRHQVRLHCSSIGLPLLGDALYGSTKVLSEVVALSSTPKFLLHAETITFQWQGSPITLSASAPSYLESLAGTLGLQFCDKGVLTR